LFKSSTDYKSSVWVSAHRGALSEAVQRSHLSFMPPLQPSPVYPLKLTDCCGFAVAPPLQHERFSLTDPMYVHISTPPHTGDGYPHTEMQVPVRGFTKPAASAHPCSSSEKPERIRSNQSHRGASRTLLIAYIPRHASAEDVEHVFEHFGTICSATITREPNGQSKCFGFVSFAKHEDAKSALEACATGRVILEDESFKAWHLKASWAHADRGKRGAWAPLKAKGA